ncbi:family 20 glycosylhydrolase [uncultured Proteiniphilum sp.]|uniref:family 20 glycosylhydrolase n=1 Tax=uncultured Proteiniphilum sp. TaxID=497637 RepID=UPI0026199E2C|nr:family 20 glycosylhydrolase [uncultured Proteiniphilum sp.]
MRNTDMSFRLIYFACALFLSAINLSAHNSSTLPVVPKPLHATVSGNVILFDNTWTVYVDLRATIDTAYISSVLKEHGVHTRFTDKKSNAVFILHIDNKISKNPEAYQLTVSEKKTITALASADNGLLHALQTIRQIISWKGNQVAIPSCKVMDEPALSWRAFMLDESRHFHGMEAVKKLLDEMAYLKMNTFHWHLVDDPGWRIEIKTYPKLTAIGSKRDFSHRDLSPGQWDEKFPERKMFYTQDEIREIVKYAEVRGIKIIPEIEVPGHASASIAAYPWLGASSSQQDKGIWGDLYNVTDPRVEAFIQDILNEVIGLFPSKIVHIGGDEADYTHWQNNPGIVQFMKDNSIPTFSDLQVWSINRYSNYLASKDVRMMGWNEITGDNIRGEAHREASQTEQLAKGTLVHFWDGDISLVNKAIDKGYDVVNSNRHFTYLDYPYQVIPLDKAYSFNPIPEGLGKEKESKIVGLGCQMWGEFTPNLTRIYYQTFPRIAAYAECGWTKAENKDYEEFCYRMKNTERRWRKSGYFNRQPSYSKQDDTFTLWQLPSQINTIGNSYVIRTDDGKIIVMDGGVTEEEGYLRGFIAALGNKVDCWFVTHPHPDHIGALTRILEKPMDIDIRQICQSTFSDKLLDREPAYKDAAVAYYEAAKKSGVQLIEAEPGMTFTFGQTSFKILGIKNEEITANPYNNSSMVIKAGDAVKSVLFLADVGAEAGNKLLNGPYRNELDCDYMQVSHHGQTGVSMDFYRTVRFRACLWPTPSWVYDNDAGGGFNTHTLTTIETRDTMDALNITEHYLSFQGLTKIE